MRKLLLAFVIFSTGAIATAQPAKDKQQAYAEMLGTLCLKEIERLNKHRYENNPCESKGANGKDFNKWLERGQKIQESVNYACKHDQTVTNYWTGELRQKINAAFTRFRNGEKNLQEAIRMAEPDGCNASVEIYLK